MEKAKYLAHPPPPQRRLPAPSSAGLGGAQGGSAAAAAAAPLRTSVALFTVGGLLFTEDGSADDVNLYRVINGVVVPMLQDTPGGGGNTAGDGGLARGAQGQDITDFTDLPLLRLLNGGGGDSVRASDGGRARGAQGQGVALSEVAANQRSHAPKQYCPMPISVSLVGLDGEDLGNGGASERSIFCSASPITRNMASLHVPKL